MIKIWKSVCLFITTLFKGKSKPKTSKVKPNDKSVSMDESKTGLKKLDDNKKLESVKTKTTNSGLKAKPIEPTFKLKKLTKAEIKKNLQNKLNDAVLEEKYELAAKFRDAINELG